MESIRMNQIKITMSNSYLKCKIWLRFANKYGKYSCWSLTIFNSFHITQSGTERDGVVVFTYQIWFLTNEIAFLSSTENKTIQNVGFL